ncbi:OprO/OprP family phosphate-selective porin [Stenotrophomonas rhizophila]|uniref:OprO/OprP family phosphate-selective porin n=1 Tax=Stenotrophomonas rhizophila TaxID=216778 RepID=UPI001E520AB4|nr:porin [Stenotrophomonas rhizophila]MCC7633822.1 porin [Stenotrophomonas rhizophila]MCC7663768.1 porin [Stenotrophomonas rhizophila]
MPAACALLSLTAPLWAAEGSDDDRPVTATLGGRLHLDFADFDNDRRGTPNKDDTEVRRAWVDVSGRFFAVDYKLEADFSDDHVEAKDVYVSRSFGDAGKLTVGQFKQFFSLDDRTSSNYGSFLERGNAGTTLAPLYRLGASWQAARGDMTWAASAYSLESIDAWQVKGRAAGGRVTWAPGATAGDVLHLGLSLAHERYDNPGANGVPGLKIRPRPAGHLSDNSRLTLVDFSAGRDTDVNKWSLEYAQVRGPLSWQGELSGATFDDGSQRGKVLAGYGMLSWFVTGESRAYDRKTGRFARVEDLQHKAGAFELALRYDQMRGDQHLVGAPDLRDAQTSAWTLGGNWYMRPNLRLMLNLIQSHNRDRLADTTVDRTRAVTGRLQFDF